jgi:hypothetical protein
VREVVGKSLPDKMMFLQGPEGVLENGVIGTSFQSLPEFGDIACLLPSDSYQAL